MAANDDVAHAEHHHGVLDHGGHATEHLAVTRHDVADIPADEEFARLGLGDHLRHHAGVRAGDEEGMGALSFGEFVEQVLAFGKDLVAEVFDTAKQAEQAVVAWSFLGHMRCLGKARRTVYDKPRHGGFAGVWTLDKAGWDWLAGPCGEPGLCGSRFSGDGCSRQPGPLPRDRR